MPKPISPARFWQQVSPTRQFVACKSEAEAKRFYARLITFFKAHHAIVSQEEAHLASVSFATQTRRWLAYRADQHGHHPHRVVLSPIPPL